MGSLLTKVSCFPDIPSPHVSDFETENAKGTKHDRIKQAKKEKRKHRRQRSKTFDCMGTIVPNASSDGGECTFEAARSEKRTSVSDAIPKEESILEKENLVLEGAGSKSKTRQGSFKLLSKDLLKKRISEKKFASSIATPELSKISAGSERRLDRSSNYSIRDSLQMQMRLATQDINYVNLQQQVDKEFDCDINQKLFEHPMHIELRFQIMNLMKRRSAHAGPDVKVWDDQIRYLQEAIISDFVNEFGTSRSKPYIASLRQYWTHLDEMHKKSFKNAQDQSLLCTNFDAAKFFEYFDVSKQGLITFEEFIVIAETASLIQGREDARLIFMFLNQSVRDAFSVYDLSCFMKQSWGGRVGQFHEALRTYMKENPGLDPETMKSTIRGKCLRERLLSWDVNEVDELQMDQGTVGAKNPKNSIFFDSNQSELIRKMRQLRKDISENSPSIAFDRDCYFSDSDGESMDNSSREPSLLGLGSRKGSYVAMRSLDEKLAERSYETESMTEKPNSDSSSFWNMQLEIENMMIFPEKKGIETPPHTVTIQTSV